MTPYPLLLRRRRLSPEARTAWVAWAVGVAVLAAVFVAVGW